MIKKTLPLLVFAALAVSFPIYAETGSGAETTSKSTHKSAEIKLSARLVDEDQLSKEKMAMIVVTVSGVTISENALQKGMGAMRGSAGTSGTTGTASGKYGTTTGSASGSTAGAHIHYQLDDGPIVATAAKSLAFANLTSGSHTIAVTLVNGAHAPISEQTTLTVNIP